MFEAGVRAAGVAVATVAGFPSGKHHSLVKGAEARLAVEQGRFAEERVLVRRKGGEVEFVSATEVDYMDVSPRQMVSAATAMIPFLEHDDANRALMGANMQRQAVPLLVSEAPLVGTGMERYAAMDAGDSVLAVKAGVVTEVAAASAALIRPRRSSSANSFIRKPTEPRFMP